MSLMSSSSRYIASVCITVSTTAKEICPALMLLITVMSNCRLFAVLNSNGSESLSVRTVARQGYR